MRLRNATLRFRIGDLVQVDDSSAFISTRTGGVGAVMMVKDIDIRSPESGLYFLSNHFSSYMRGEMRRMHKSIVDDVTGDKEIKVADDYHYFYLDDLRLLERAEFIAEESRRRHGEVVGAWVTLANEHLLSPYDLWLPPPDHKVEELNQFIAILHTSAPTPTRTQGEVSHARVEVSHERVDERTR